MSYGMQTTILTAARAAGSDNPNGERFGGIYYPAHTKNGVSKDARWEGIIILNGKPYRDNTGQLVDGKSTSLRLVVWNGKNAAAGEGMADIFAKNVSVGKEISCNVRIDSFEKRLFEKGQPLLRADGSAVTYPAHSFVFEDKLKFGPDAAGVVAKEIARWDGTPSFDSRPPLWNVPGSGDQQAWATLVAPARKAAVWDGQAERYGYARVIVPEGAIIGNPTTNIQVGTSPTIAANMTSQAAPIDPPAPINTTNTPFTAQQNPSQTCGI